MTAERARSFGQIAERYHRYRPRTPAALLDWALPASAHRVLDLAAGTGALTEQLVSRVRSVVAVEPDPDMRRVLTRVAPGADVREGTAEDIPLEDGTVDAVLVSSAWHWFELHAAVAEIARVLRPGGRLAVVGNGPDGEVDWVLALHGEDPDRAARPDRRHGVELPPEAPFHDAATTELAWSWQATVEDVLGLLSTYSRAIVASEQENAAREERARAVLRSAPASGGRLTVPMRSTGFRATRT